MKRKSLQHLELVHFMKHYEEEMKTKAANHQVSRFSISSEKQEKEKKTQRR